MSYKQDMPRCKYKRNSGEGLDEKAVAGGR